MLSGIELPLGSPSGIAVDHNGRIYVGSLADMRVQRYGADGKFDRGWHVPRGKGDWHMLLDRQNRLTLMVGNHFFFHLDDRDQLLNISEQHDNSFLEQLRHAPIKQTIAPDHNTYLLHSFPAGVSCVDEDGQRHEAFRQGFVMVLFTGPLPAFIIFLLGIALSKKAML